MIGSKLRAASAQTSPSVFTSSRGTGAPGLCTSVLCTKPPSFAASSEPSLSWSQRPRMPGGASCATCCAMRGPRSGKPMLKSKHPARGAAGAPGLPLLHANWDAGELSKTAEVCKSARLHEPFKRPRVLVYSFGDEIYRKVRLSSTAVLAWRPIHRLAALAWSVRWWAWLFRLAGWSASNTGC